MENPEQGWGQLWAPVDVEPSRVVQLSSGFNTSLMFPFEHYNEMGFYRWAVPTNWRQCFIYSIIYVIVIFGGRKLMEKRQRFELRTALTLWNLFLAIFSICGAVRMNQELFYSLRTHGLEYSFCVPSYGQVPFGFWVVGFALSKVLEFGDTLFIVLRKQPLIFLHWYHHVATLIYTWVAYTERLSSGRWFITMNFTVHAFMYSYYATRAMRIRVPRWVNVCITTMQTLQMVVGLAVNYGVLVVKNRGDHCQQSYGNVALAMCMYFSYFLLFSWYFYNAYIRAQPKRPVTSTSKSLHQNGVHQNGVHQNGVANGVANGVTNGIKKYN